jgi:hypothetical protein
MRLISSKNTKCWCEHDKFQTKTSIQTDEIASFLWCATERRYASIVLLEKGEIFPKIIDAVVKKEPRINRGSI